MATPLGSEVIEQLEKRLKLNRDSITFDKDSLEGTSSSHDDVLVVTLRIGGFLVKKVMIDQGSGAEMMYFDLYKGLGLKPEDLSKYDTLSRVQWEDSGTRGADKAPSCDRGKGGYGKFHSS